jgi:hypothetical protein
MTTYKRPAGHVQAVPLVALRPHTPLPRASDYDWPQSPALELLALRVQLEAACRKGEARQGWIPCRVVRRAMGVPA